MARWIFVCFLVIFIVPLAGGCSRDGEKNNFHAFGVEHAWLHLEYFGETRGTEDIFEDSMGLRETRIIHSDLMADDGFHPNYTCSVRNGSKVVVVDSVKHEEVRTIDKTSDSLYHLSAGDVPTPDEQFGSYTGKRGYVLRGDTNLSVSGMTLKAHIWQLGEQTSYIYEFKGFIVGSLTRINGHGDELRLISMDTINPIAPARFVSPFGFDVIDMTNSKSQGTSSP